MFFLRKLICFFRGHPVTPVYRPRPDSVLGKGVCDRCKMEFMINFELDQIAPFRWFENDINQLRRFYGWER